ncbi:polyamine aminopropyltransferase [Pseudaeromonas sp. ZJS20]|uniref:polyamine aminopropyltransferase n=1 Tax=Pseudaeromonas aegiceratis TaxID=3153928 RepID=UPI00390C8B2C
MPIDKPDPAAAQPQIEWLTPHLGLAYRVDRTLMQTQSPYQLIDVLQTPAFGRVFRLDGCLMTAEADEWFYHENLALLPAISHPAPRRALVIGGGDGGSARQLLKDRQLTSLVVCELDAQVVDMAKRYFASVHQGAFDDPRLRLQIGDGLAYVAQSQAQVDLLVLDLTDPQGFAAPLYQPAFFNHCARLLGEQGVLSLHLGSPQWQPQRVSRLLADLRQQFAIVRLILVPIALYGGLWAMACASQRTDPKALTSAEVERRLLERGIDGLNYYNGDTHVAALALPNFVRRLLPAERPA